MSLSLQHDFQNEYLQMNKITSLSHVYHNSNAEISNLENQTQQVISQSNNFNKVEDDNLKLDHCYYKIQQQYSLSPEYLELHDSTTHANDEVLEDNNYYDVLSYELVKNNKYIDRRHLKWLITGVTVCILLLFFFLSGVILTKYVFNEKSNLSLAREQEYCSEFTAKSANHLSCQRSFVRNMTISAFAAYHKHAWGAPELDALNLEPYTNSRTGNYPGLTIVDAMSTLWVMDLKEEWAAGKDWIYNNLNFANVNEVVQVREAILDYLGGLLSAYSLSGDVLFLKKAKEVYKTLVPSFNEATGMLAHKFNPKGKTSSINATSVLNTNDHHLENDNFIAWIGFQQPEFILIANLTGEKVIVKRLKKNRALMKTAKLSNG